MSRGRARPARGLWSRRTVLYGAGVALTLPWLESLSRDARAQAAPAPRRFLPIYLPNGAPDLWKPASAASGSGWTLSSVLEPLAALKTRTSVLSGLENASVFNVDGSPSVEPPHSRQAGAWLTCVDADVVSAALGVSEANGVSVDQLLAAHPTYQGATSIPSLQVGLSSTLSSCDGRACSLSRSISWQTETKPLYKEVNPNKLFSRLVGEVAVGEANAQASARRAARRSVLDAVLESAALVKPKLSAADSQTLDGFFESVRELERRVDATTTFGNRACERSDQEQGPNFPEVGGDVTYQNNTALYSKGRHAQLMNELIALAFRCDLTRVVSYMLEDENSEFVYDEVSLRRFTASSSEPSVGRCGSYSGAQHGSVDEFASITHWNVARVADLCSLLMQTDDGNGQSVLDNTVVFLGSGMHGSNHQCSDLPALLVGGGGGALVTDQHLALTSRPLRDLYFTLLNGVFQLGVTDFGVHRGGAPLALISELLR